MLSQLLCTQSAALRLVLSSTSQQQQLETFDTETDNKIVSKVNNTESDSLVLYSI